VVFPERLDGGGEQTQPPNVDRGKHVAGTVDGGQTSAGSQTEAAL